MLAELQNDAGFLVENFEDPIFELTCNVEARGNPPPYLRGTYLYNGPAKFQLAGRGYRNWLDGDGMIASLTMDCRQAVYRSRFVQSNKLILETSAGKRIYRAFGTSFAGDKLKRGIGTECPFNVSVFPYRGKLLAFGEQSLPIELDPLSLETIHPGCTYDFDGSLNDAVPFSAHPKIDQLRNELLNFGVFFSPHRPTLTYYRLDASGLACRKQLPLDAPYTLHDFAISQRYAVFYISPYSLDVEKLMTSSCCTLEALSWQPDRGSQLLVLDRERGNVVAKIALPGRYCLHTIRACESGDALLVEVIELERPMYDQYQLDSLLSQAPQGQAVRYEVCVQTHSIRQYTALPPHRAPDFPVCEMDNVCSNDLWMLSLSQTERPGGRGYDQLVHQRWSQPNFQDVWHCPPNVYLGSEPAFVHNPATAVGSGHGVLLCHLFNAAERSSQIAVFQSDNISAGPIAYYPLKHRAHLGFHAAFLPTDGLVPELPANAPSLSCEY